MHVKTPNLLRAIRRAPNTHRKTDILHNQFYGETAYVFSCGPSFSDVWTSRVRDALLGKFTVAVKSTISKLQSVVPDMYWYNPVRIANLVGNIHPDTLRIASSNRTNRHNIDVAAHGCDILYALQLNGPENTLMATQRFDDGKFPAAGEKIPDRPWGPGVLLDGGLFLLQHMGFKRIIVVGWDMGEQYTHFYSDKDLMGQESIQVERDYCKAGAPALEKWFAKQGVTLQLCSPRSELGITQISIDELIESTK